MSVPDLAKTLDAQLHDALEPIFKEEADERASTYKKMERAASHGKNGSGRTSTASSLFFGICVGVVLTGISSMRRA